MRVENTLFWRYDAQSPLPVEQVATDVERSALADVLRCLPREVCQLGGRFDSATEAASALLNSSLALTRHLASLLNAWYLAEPLPDAVRGIAERTLVKCSTAPQLSYGNEAECLRALLAAHAEAGPRGWPELATLSTTHLPPECALYKLAGAAVHEASAEMPLLQPEYLQLIVSRYIRAHVLPSVTVLDFLATTVPLRNDTTGHNVGFSPSAAALVARYLAPALRAFLLHDPVRLALGRVRVGQVIRVASATKLEVHLDTQGLDWPGDIVELEAAGLPTGAGARVVVRVGAPRRRPGTDDPLVAARFPVFPEPFGQPADAERTVQAQVLGYLLRDGLPPPAPDALQALDHSGWVPAALAEREAYAARVSRPVIEAYTRWSRVVEGGAALTEADVLPLELELLARADSGFTALPMAGRLARLTECVAAGGEARRRLVRRLVSDPLVAVADVARTVGDATLTLHALRAMERSEELATNLPEIVNSGADLLAAGAHAWVVRPRLHAAFSQLEALQRRAELIPGAPARWAAVRVLVEALRELVEVALTPRDFPSGEAGMGAILAILDGWLTEEEALAPAPRPVGPSPGPGPSPPQPAEPPPPPQPVSAASASEKTGLRLRVAGNDFVARGITGIYRELARAYSDQPDRLQALAALAGPGARIGIDQSLFYSAEQLAQGARIRQPVRLRMADKELYFEGGVAPDVGLLHLARLLTVAGLPGASAALNGTRLYPVADLVGPARRETSAGDAPQLKLVYVDPSLPENPQVAQGGTVAAFLTALLGTLLRSDQNLRALDVLLPADQAQGSCVRRYLVARTPIHKDGTPFRAPFELVHPRAGVLYIETYLSEEAAAEGAALLLERLGLIEPVVVSPA